jgi:hypothetical protein
MYQVKEGNYEKKQTKNKRLNYAWGNSEFSRAWVIAQRNQTLLGGSRLSVSLDIFCNTNGGLNGKRTN